jgi:hypothetical protein
VSITLQVSNQYLQHKYTLQQASLVFNAAGILGICIVQINFFFGENCNETPNGDIFPIISFPEGSDFRH